ncbi:MAG TPA: hypothetical protein VMH23_10680 [Bacteroidota bacterium]|nr:hypothetical protein [Bacteroidota bacterium]
MNRTASTILVSGLTILLIINGCTNSPNGPGGSTPSVPSLSFSGPKTNSTDAKEQSVASQVASMNAFAQQFLVVKNLAETEQGSTSTWKYATNGLTVTFTASEQADGSSRWTMVLNGTDTSGTGYKNFTAGRGTIGGDGKSGTWDVYDTTSTTPVGELTWSTSNNVLTGTLKSFTSGVLSAQTVVVNNPDHSGQLTLYDASSLMFKAVWQSTGSGNWWTYDPNGAETGTGNWT